jgi:DNA-binding GntR family transcriptional regulator
MKDTETKETLIEVAVERLTADIISGALPPEKKLQIADLKERYGIGASPLREGLAQLSTLGFVVFDSRRGFRVTPISKEDLDDITALRKVIETTALRQSIEFGDDEWEVGIVTAFARLERVVARITNPDNTEETDLEQAHKQLHIALVSACRSRRLQSLQSVLYDQARRYRHLMLEQLHDLQTFLTIHDELVKVILSRQSDKACAMLSGHIDLTPGSVYPENM